MSFNPDMTDSAIMKRFDQANMVAIISHSKVMFASLQDIPDLLKERAMLLTMLSHKDKLLAEVSHEQQPSPAVSGVSDEQ